MGTIENKRGNWWHGKKTRQRLKAIGAPCAICGKPIDYDLDWWIDPKDGKRKRHPLSFEYDHAVPLAQGGGNEWENAQPAHRVCNQRKNDGRKRKKKVLTGSLMTSRAW